MKRTLLMVAAVALAVYGVFLLSGDTHKRPPDLDVTPIDNLVLITIDSLRPDRLGAYGYQGNTSPNIDALAERSVVYAKAYAHAPLTTPSHASIMTGKIPPEHGLRQVWSGVLGAENTTLAELASQAGLRSAAFVGSSRLRKSVGLNQGFSDYDDGALSAHNPSTERTAEQTTDAASAWIRQNKDGRFFVWVHYFDPHPPYLHHRAYDIAAAAVGLSRPFSKAGASSYAYDSEVHYVDSQVGRLLRSLRDQGVADKTAVVLTAGHGESFAESGRVGGSGVDESALRIPLVIYHPEMEDWAVVVEKQPARQIDIFATAVAMIGTKTQKPTSLPWVFRVAGLPRRLQPVTRSAIGARWLRKIPSNNAEPDPDPVRDPSAAVADYSEAAGRTEELVAEVSAKPDEDSSREHARSLRGGVTYVPVAVYAENLVRGRRDYSLILDLGYKLSAWDWPLPEVDVVSEGQGADGGRRLPRSVALYDLRTDPGEIDDLSDRYPGRTAKMLAQLDELRRGRRDFAGINNAPGLAAAN